MLAASSSENSLLQCPDKNWTVTPEDATWGPKCYKLPEVASFAVCAESCASEAGSIGGKVKGLACIGSHAENKFIKNSVINSTSATTEQYWIGNQHDQADRKYRILDKNDGPSSRTLILQRKHEKDHGPTKSQLTPKDSRTGSPPSIVDECCFVLYPGGCISRYGFPGAPCNTIRILPQIIFPTE